VSVTDRLCGKESLRVGVGGGTGVLDGVSVADGSFVSVAERLRGSESLWLGVGGRLPDAVFGIVRLGDALCVGSFVGVTEWLRGNESLRVSVGGGTGVLDDVTDGSFDTLRVRDGSTEALRVCDSELVAECSCVNEGDCDAVGT
jgi:hypothetical protein